MAIQENQLLKATKAFLKHRFNLHRDSATEQEILIQINNGTEFVGTNLWTLIFAIFIASIGLNVNSTAVIIGAMLISPLMGPIMGIGMGLGVNDFELVKKGARNLAIATIISIITSSIYFYFSPLHDAQSEVLARTTPSIWDVFIAFFGGLAGIVAQTRKEKSNVIPGVAIATALMPPLCTAGYGIANGNLFFFLGALYLYFINTVFIGISAFLIVRFMNFEKRHFEDKKYEKRVSRYIILIITITIIPSIFFAIKMVEKSIFENNAQRFISEQFSFKNTQVVNRSLKYNYKTSEIDLLLLGENLPQHSIDTITQNLEKYKLKDVRLSIRQGLNAKKEIDFSQIKASILEDVFKRDSLSFRKGEASTNWDDPVPNLKDEVLALYPSLKYYAADNVSIENIEKRKRDSLMMIVSGFNKTLTKDEENKLENWLKQRLKVDTLKLVLEYQNSKHRR